MKSKTHRYFGPLACKRASESKDVRTFRHLYISGCKFNHSLATTIAVVKDWSSFPMVTLLRNTRSGLFKCNSKASLLYQAASEDYRRGIFTIVRWGLPSALWSFLKRPIHHLEPEHLWKASFFKFIIVTAPMHISKRIKW